MKSLQTYGGGVLSPRLQTSSNLCTNHHPHVSNTTVRLKFRDLNMGDVVILVVLVSMLVPKAFVPTFGHHSRAHCQIFDLFFVCWVVGVNSMPMVCWKWRPQYKDKLQPMENSLFSSPSSSQYHLKGII